MPFFFRLQFDSTIEYFCHHSLAWFLPSKPSNDYSQASIQTSTLKTTLQTSSSNQPSVPQVCPLDLITALKTSNLPSWLLIRPPGFNQPSVPQICSLGLILVIWGLKYASQDIWKFTPVSYKTSAFWGRWPALTQLLRRLVFISKALSLVTISFCMHPCISFIPINICWFLGRSIWLWKTGDITFNSNIPRSWYL